MPTVGEIERKFQRRLAKLFPGHFGYTSPGDWTDREGNTNIEPELFHGWLTETRAFLLA
jgi:hypothetical protein